MTPVETEEQKKARFDEWKRSDDPLALWVKEVERKIGM